MLCVYVRSGGEPNGIPFPRVRAYEEHTVAAVVWLNYSKRVSFEPIIFTILNLAECITSGKSSWTVAFAVAKVTILSC